MKKENVYNYKGKLIGYFIEIERKENLFIFEELPKKLPVQVDLNRINYIVNFTDISKPSAYYRISN
jgi:hypothetical protein